MRLHRHMAGRPIVEKEMKRLLQEGFNLRDEIDHLKKGKVLRGKHMKMGVVRLFRIAPVYHIAVRVQTEG